MYYFFSNTCNNLPDYEEIIEKIDIPVAVIWGKNDDMLQWEPQKEHVIDSLNIKVKDIHLLDAKHFIQEEKPDHINSIILNLVAKLFVIWLMPFPASAGRLAREHTGAHR